MALYRSFKVAADFFSKNKQKLSKVPFTGMVATLILNMASSK